MPTALDELGSDLLAELTEFRRDLHSHPELGFEKIRTAARVAAALRAWGVDVTEAVGGTGVVGTIRGVGPHRSAGRHGCAVACRGNRPPLRVSYTRRYAWM